MKKEMKEKTKETNNIQKLIKFLSFGQAFLIAVPLVRLMLVIIVTVGLMIAGENVTITEVAYEFFNLEKPVFTTLKAQVVYYAFVIFSVLGYIINISLLNKIEKILRNTEEAKTPFTENNIVLLDKIKGLVFVSFITMFLGNKFGMSLIPLVVVIGLIGVFKHGYKLQQEVDETL